MFSATRKKFVEGVESDYPDESMYYGQPSMFPHRSEKDVNTNFTCYSDKMLKLTIWVFY